MTVQTTCTSDLGSVGSCNLVEYSQDLPEIYQNFKSVAGVEDRNVARLGSSVTLADFCPYVQEFTWRGGGLEEGRGTRCDDPNNAPPHDDNYALESYGSQSKCFRQASQWEEKSCTMIKSWSRYGSGCYSYRCSDGRLHIMVRNVSYTCSYPGEKVPVQLTKVDSSGERWLHSGTLLCPDCQQVCGDCTSGAESGNHHDNRENLGDCFLQTDNSAGNLLIDFLKEFGATGFNLN